MNAYLSNIAIKLKERDYIFNDLTSIPNPDESSYTLVEVWDQREIFITKIGVLPVFRVVRVGTRYLKLT